MSTLLLPYQAVTLTVAASDKLATFSAARYLVTKSIGYPNLPATTATVYDATGSNVTAAFAAATSVTIQAGSEKLYYMTGTGPVISERFGLNVTQGVPGTLNATGTLTAALILGGIVTSTTAAAVVATLDTGAVMDAVTDLAINDGFYWTAIATGANSFTVTAAASGHTIVGSGVVATVTSGSFLTSKTAADTFVTYRL
jgi:hypothetical protein